MAESRHRVHAAVADADGTLLASVGDPGLVTHFRSAAKPFQALPLVEDGVTEAFGIPAEELALCCASHSGEDAHVRGVRSLLARAGVPETALELGAHEPMRDEAAAALIREGREPAPIHNNCSGKHAGMLALARHRGWPLEGYRLSEHPVQRRMTEVVAEWTGVEAARIRPGVDGCGVVCFGVPLGAMARSFAALGRAAAEGRPGPAAVVDAMTAHPFAVAGTGRLCTRLMEAARGEVFAKVGAEGVYCAAARDGRMGVAVKIEDGARRAAEVALLRILELLGLLGDEALAELQRDRRRVVTNTRGEAAAFLEPEIRLDAGARMGAVPRGKEATDGLDRRTRALVRASGAVATRDAATLREALRAAHGAAPQAEVEEALVQTYLFVGFPGALHALAVWRELAGDREGRTPEEDGTGPTGSDGAESLADWERRGETVCRRVYGARYENLRSNIRALHPDLDRWMVLEGYGKVLGRPGLELPERELCIVGLLAVLDAPVQLYSHLRGALAVGATPAEVEAALGAVEDLAGADVRRRAREQWEAVRSRRRPPGEEGEG